MSKKSDAIRDKAREAIAQFVEDEAPNFRLWLQQIAEGIKAENGGMLTRPDPARAFELLSSLLEYHIPKLARTELTGDGGKPIQLVMSAEDSRL